jgi:hypothetical protein
MVAHVVDELHEAERLRQAGDRAEPAHLGDLGLDAPGGHHDHLEVVAAGVSHLAQDLPAVSHRERRVQQAQPRVIAVDEVESGLAAGGRQTWYPARPSLWCMNRSRRTSSPATTIRGRIMRDERAPSRPIRVMVLRGRVRGHGGLLRPCVGGGRSVRAALLFH